MLTFHINEGPSREDFPDLIFRQREHGGRLILYKRAWAALIVVTSQSRIEWVPLETNRHLTGWRHSLFTCLLGIWSPVSVIGVPMILFTNFLGGIDVTEFYSTATIDPLRDLKPTPGTAAREGKRAQWSTLAFLIIALAVILCLVIE